MQVFVVDDKPGDIVTVIQKDLVAGSWPHEQRRPLKPIIFGYHNERIETWRENDVELSICQRSSNFKYRDRLQNWPRQENNCVPWEPWQGIMFPTCATMHELDMTSEIEFLARGGRREVWKVSSLLHGAEEIVLKTLKMNRFNRDGERKLAEMQKVDAVAMERLTSSKHIMDIFGFCGQSALNEMGDTTLSDFILKHKMTSIQKTQLARNAAAALSDVHSFGSRAMIVHGDVRPWNFLMSKSGSLMLNDFNAGGFIHRNITTQGPNMIESSSSCGITKYRGCRFDRSPEECLKLPATETIDVYHLGNILYYIMTGHSPPEKMDRLQSENGLERKTVCEACARSFHEGLTPYNYTLPPQLRSSADPAIAAIQDAMFKCQILDPVLRTSAQEIVEGLDKTLMELLKM